MIKCKIYTIGKLKEKWLTLALLEYEKRLSSFFKISWELKKDDKILESSILKEKAYIALDLKGEFLNSEDFSKKIISILEDNGSNLCFVIGGSDGLSKKIIHNAQCSISLSMLTFTHQMTRLILIEQLYRAFEIQKGTKYHK